MERPRWLTGAVGSKKTFVSTPLNGITPGGLYVVAGGFTPAFGLMRNVNLARGSI